MVRNFYGDVLPETGNYCLVKLPEGQHIWADSLDELAALTAKHTERHGLYFGTAAFSSFANRKQTNVLALQALRLDIDAGPEKLKKHGPEVVYATQRDALAACLGFFKETALAPTYVVSSGAGLHIYYCLTRPLPEAEWKPLAEGLQRLGDAKGLKIDASVTCDSARILRVPGAPHPNGKRVEILKATGVKHGPDALRTKLGAAAPVRKFDTSINAEAVATYQGPPSSAVKIAQHCGALAEVATSRGDVPEPHWRAMIGLVKRTKEGLDIAQEWSDGYEGYDPDEVEKKFHAWTAGPTTCAEFARHSKACATCPHNGKVKSPINLGLMTSKEIDTLPPEQKAEIAVAAEPAEPEATGDPWDGRIPAGFSVEQIKGRHVLVQSKLVQKDSDTGEKVPVMEHIPFTFSIFWLSRWAEAEGDTDKGLAELRLITSDGLKTYNMEQHVVASQTDLNKFLGGKTIHTTDHKKASQAMQDYVRAQLRHIYDSSKSVKVTDRLGLRTLSDGTLVCAHGLHTIYPDGSIRESLMDPSLRGFAEMFPIPLPPSNDGTWGPDVWDSHIVPRAQEHVQFMRKYYAHPGLERLQLAIMLVIASPLMAFATGGYTGGSKLPTNSSLNVSLYSRESARGKTTAAQAGVLAYGSPGALVKDTGKSGATVNGRLGRLSLHGTMPNVMDEVTDLESYQVADLISAVANGAAKQTMTSDRSLRHEAAWALINLVTTNKSQRDMATIARSDSASPVLYRLLEIDADGLPEYTEELRTSHREDWATVGARCAGALGAVIHREICARGLPTMATAMAACITRAEKLLSATQSARFQSRGLGAVLLVASILNSRGLLPFQVKDLVDEFRKAHDAIVDYIRENATPPSPLEQLAKALLDLAPHTLVTYAEKAESGRDVRALNARPVDVVKARHIQSKGRTYLQVEALRGWCKDNNAESAAIIKAARAAGVLVTYAEAGASKDGTVARSSRRRSLTVGVEAHMGLPAHVYEFDTVKLARQLKMDAAGFSVVEGGKTDEAPREETAASS